MPDLMDEWMEHMEEYGTWEDIPATDPEGYSNKQIDSLINQHFGTTEPVAAPQDKVEITKTIPLTKQDTSAKVPVVKEKGTPARKTRKKEKVTMTASNGVRVRKPKAGQEVTPFGKRGRPSKAQQAQRVAEIEAGYVLPVKNVNPTGKRGRPALFVRITVAEHQRLLAAAGELTAAE